VVATLTAEARKINILRLVWSQGSGVMKAGSMQEFPSFMLEGYANFMAGRYVTERARYRELAEKGQTPTTMVIACCDSRAAPETIFDCGPGQLFVLRNVANLVPPYEPEAFYHGTFSAIEFAVIHLKVQNIVVLGHGRCGGIQAALSTAVGQAPEGDFIGKWLTMVGPIAEKASAEVDLTAPERQTTLERIAIKQSVANLSTIPAVKSRMDAGTMKLHGAWFDISSGALWVLDGPSGEFVQPDLQVPA
jgi:carbonic anhydrase